MRPPILRSQCNRDTRVGGLYPGLRRLTHRGFVRREFSDPLRRRRIRAIPSAVRLRDDFSAATLRGLAKRAKDANQNRRLLSLAAAPDRMDRGAAAKISGMDRQTLRDGVHRFNAAGPDGLLDHWTNGPMPRLKPEQLAELAAIAEAGPDRKRDGVARWPWVDLERIIAALKKLADVLSARLPDLPKGTPVEIWFQDEARIGEKNGLVRQRARRGTRLRQPADQRYENAYLFGAICPHARNRRGAGAAFRQYGSDADPPRRDRRRRRPCRADLRPRRLAHHAQSRLPAQPCADLAALARP